MDDLSSAISGFLAQPGAVEQLEAMAKQLGLGTARHPEEAAPNRGEPGADPSPDSSRPSDGPLDVGSLDGLLPEGLTPEKIGKLMQAVQEGGRPDQATEFLEALRPLLGSGRQEKLDRALRAVRLMHTARAVTKSIEL